MTRPIVSSGTTPPPPTRYLCVDGRFTASLRQVLFPKPWQRVFEWDTFTPGLKFWRCLVECGLPWARIRQAFELLVLSLEAGDYEPHLDNIRDIYRQKRDALDQLLKNEVSEYLDWHFPEGGFYLWATLKKGMLVTPLWRTAVEEGIAVNPGNGFSQPGTPPAECIRIAYAWTPIEQFAEAAKRLRIACERVVAGDAA